MSASRRELLVAGSLTPLALALGPARAAATPRLLLDRPGRPGEHAVVVPSGSFVDDRFVAALPPGRYRASLTPANALLLREVLRSRRVAVHGDALLAFTLGA